MADIITLSSSPAATFARSPTPVTFPSSPRGISNDSRSNNDAVKPQFKPAQALRDGFSSGFTSARHVLAAKPNAENVPVIPSKFPQPKLDFPPADHVQLPRPAPTKRPSKVSQIRLEQAAQANVSSHDEMAQPTVIKVLPSDARRNRKTRIVEPLNLAKAVGRRNDCTPPKEIAVTSDITETNTFRFGVDLQQSFGNASSIINTGSTYSAKNNAPHKRRKIDSTSTETTTPVLKPMASIKNGKSATKARNKSPAKKPLTITGLTTSHYLEDDPQQGNLTLMMQFLASTQARMQSENSSETFETKLTKKPANSKVKKSRSRLKSPRTSMKTINEQDVVFASASQLARDESPTLIRDTVEAIKQSEEEDEPFADHIFTQQTAPISIEATSPKAGIARYRGRKNLWNAAHRDENDALLYHNDPFDEPNVRVNLTGKDAPVEHDPGEDSNELVDDSFALLAVLNKETTITYDIDDLTTPSQPATKGSNLPLEMKRSFSTSTHSLSKRMKDATPPPQDIDPDLEDVPIDAQKPKVPPKPNYASWTDEQLKEQVKEYGFNRLRARKSMIDKLDEYWAQKYGLDIAAVKAATKAASKNVADRDHGSFLSDVHELAPRPVPKSKKPRTKRSDGELFTAISKRKSKSKLVEVSKLPDPTEDSILDIDEIDDTNVLERLAAIVPFSDDEPMDSLEPSTAPVRGTGVKATTKPKAKRKKKTIERPLTPPPTYPEDPIQDSSPGFESPRAAPDPVTRPVLPDDTTLRFQIHAAILDTTLKNDRRRNHQTNPTWHEKILLYDPIVVEDFTAWLNTEGFNGIGIDEEIDAKDVKVWCEENGICCLWKGGWRGNKVKE